MPKTETFNREEVLERVTDLFWIKGFNGTSMQDIVDVTGLNRSSIYNSFGDKYQLFNESMNFYKNHVQSRNISGIDNPSIKEGIRSIFETVLDTMDERTNTKGCFLTNCTAELASTDKEINGFLNQNLNDVLSLFTEMLEKGKENGQLDKNMNVHETALYLFSSLQGIKVTGMILENKDDVKSLIDKTMENI